MYVTISGFDLSPIGTPYLGNIPINFLNGTHRIYFTNPDIGKSELINIPLNNIVNNINGFYILLPKKYFGIVSISIMNITLTFNHIGGIPINKINAEYPVDNDHIYGYHLVNSTTKDTISILMNKISHYKSKRIVNDVVVEEEIQFGKDNITIAKILDITTGYSTPSNYKLLLPQLFHNVFKVKITSSSFPNTMKIFDRENKKNRR
jgi:hypothetical protein